MSDDLRERIAEAMWDDSQRMLHLLYPRDGFEPIPWKDSTHKGHWRSLADAAIREHRAHQSERIERAGIAAALRMVELQLNGDPTMGEAAAELAAVIRRELKVGEA